MQKCLIFLTLLLSFSAWAMPSWNPYLMTHERFVHLSPEEQEQIIIKTMEMIVELDDQTQKSVVSNDKVREYFVLIKKLQSFVMSDAYAQETTHILKLAQNFSGLLEKLGPQGCIYAGYVSRMVSGRCRSPELLPLKGKDAALNKLIKASYQSGTACAGPTKITCNPVVFGFKNNKNQAPFCVTTGPTEAHNASYNCMNKALSVTQEKGADSKEERLNFMKDVLKDPKSAPAFNSAHKYIFRTCVCGDTSLNSTYKAYMRPHRTCFGMLNTLRQIESSECSVLNSDGFKASFAEEWSKYFGSSKFPTQDAKKSVQFDKGYGTMMSKQDLKVMCGIGADGDDDGGGPTDGDDSDGTVCEAPCTYEVDKDKKKVLTCTVKTVTVTKAGKSETFSKFKTDKFTPKDGDEEMSVSSEDGKQTFTCPIVKPIETDGDKCTITATDAEDKKSTTLTVAFADGKEHKAKWDGEGKPSEDNKSFVADLTKGKKTISVMMDGAEKADCSLEVGTEEASDGKEYAIEAKEQSFSSVDLTIKVKAVVTVTGGDAKMPETYQIVWVRSKEYKGPAAVAKPKIDEESKNKVQDEPVAVVKPEGKADAPAPTKSETAGADTSEIDEPRTTDEYKSCAQLMNDKGEKVTESCAPIAKLGTGRAPGTGSNRPPVFMTPSYNTRTMGIQ